LLKGLRPDDFVAQTLARAGSISFLAMLLALPVCDWLSRRLEALPAEYIVDFRYAVLLGAYSIAFLVLTHLATRAERCSRDSN
jgi:hypothetical protein